MDSRVGACWRCGRQGETKCPGCEFAVYCSPGCQTRDRFRHEVECTNCAVQHRCSHCSRVSGDAKKCSACDMAWYCNQACQRADFGPHKSDCRAVQQKIVQVATMLRMYFSMMRGLRKLSGFPYYWGNSPAQDLIKIDRNEGDYPEKMALLLAGSGNLRNVMATVAGLKRSFGGSLYFALNDVDPQVTARNVFFLYFLWKHRGEEGVARQLTQIWYSVKIGEEEATRAQECLRELLSLPDDTGTLCGGTVTMATEQLAQIRTVFQLWLTLLAGHRTLMMTPQEQLRLTYKLSADGVDKIMRSIPRRHRPSAEDWFKNGVLLPTSDPRRKRACRDNVTLAAWNPAHDPDLSWRELPNVCSQVGEIAAGINDDGMPFAEWDYLDVKAQSPGNNLLAMYSHYIEGIITQFADMFHQGRVFCHVILADCLSVKAHLPADIRFDRIFTSNLGDYINFPVLLETLSPLLRKDNRKSVIITEFLNMPNYFPEATLVDADPPLGAALFLKAQEDLRREPDWTNPADRFDMVCNTGATSIIEYFDNWSMFNQYLRAALLAHRCPESTHPVLSRRDVPKMSEVSNTCGMKMRNFLKDLNTVWPFRLRINARRVNPLRGLERVLEWTLQEKDD